MDENKTSPTSASTLPEKYAKGNVKSALNDRMTLSESIEAVGRMISGYANRGQADRSYVGALAALLCDYPRVIATQCSSPVHGVARKCKFMPTIADVVEWCQPKLEEMRAPSQQASHWDDLKAQAKARAQREFQYHGDRETRPRLGATRSDLKEIYGIRDVPQGWDAVDVCRAKARYGDKFHDEVERALATQTAPPSDFGGVLGAVVKNVAAKAGYVTDEELRAKYGPRHDDPAI